MGRPMPSRIPSGTRVGNQKKTAKPTTKKTYEPLDQGHVELVIHPVFTADYSNTLIDYCGQFEDLHR
jgi:hypothetical protein